MSISGRFIFLLIATGVAWLLAVNTGRGLAYNMAYMLSAILGISMLWASMSLRGVTIRRYTRTRRSQVGQFAEEQFEIANHGAMPKLWIEIEDYSTLPWHDASHVVSSLRRNSSFRWQVKTLCTQRGRFRLGSMLIRSGDPLGVFDVEQHLPHTSYLIVYPLTVDLPSFEPTLSDLSGGEARRRWTYQVTTNAAGVRDYMPGDSLNRIHWPTTARVRRLMTKEFELDPTADVWIYLDLYQGAEAGLPWEPHPPEVGLFLLEEMKRRRSQMELPPVTTEYSITVAASIARYFLMRNRAVGMSSRGHTREYLQADRGERQLHKILETLAVMDAGGTLPFAHMVITDVMRLNRNDTVLAISADPSPEWAQALQHAQRRGVNSMAVVVDGSTFGRVANYSPLFAKLEAASIPTYHIRRDEPIASALSHPSYGAPRQRPYP